MEQLIIRSRESVRNIALSFQRYLMREIAWDWRLIGIKGARGVGKTTLLLQHLKQVRGEMGKAIYLSLDDLYFTDNTLLETIKTLQAYRYTYFYLDEVHKYETWARELKNLYDQFPDIHIVFTGSSIIELNKQEVDLSRRAVMYDMQGLSFREYLSLVTSNELPVLVLEDILLQHEELYLSHFTTLTPLIHFQDYLSMGYYPYFLENRTLYHRRLSQTIQLVIETDLNFIKNVNIRQTQKIAQLLYIVAISSPFKPNISKLSERMGIERNTLLYYLHYLEKAQLLSFLYSPNKGISLLQKPDKIYLENTNLSYTLALEQVNKGSLRETFFFNQLKYLHTLHYSNKADFWVDEKYLFEIGGKNKGKAQIRGTTNAYIVSDDIEQGVGNRIPLWMFGFLY